jgi:hypothetical protein
MSTCIVVSAESSRPDECRSWSIGDPRACLAVPGALGYSAISIRRKSGRLYRCVVP